MLIAFEGIDQSGKATQAARATAWLRARGHDVLETVFPEYSTPTGKLIRSALDEGGLDPLALQMLNVANRAEWSGRIRNHIAEGGWVVADRWIASGLAYGEAQGIETAGLRMIQGLLPQAGLTVLLDIDPQAAAARKPGGRDRIERDGALLARARSACQRLALDGGWPVVDGSRPREEAAAEIAAALERARAGRGAEYRGRIRGRHRDCRPRGRRRGPGDRGGWRRPGRSTRGWRAMSGRCARAPWTNGAADSRPNAARPAPSRRAQAGAPTSTRGRWRGSSSTGSGSRTSPEMEARRPAPGRAACTGRTRGACG